MPPLRVALGVILNPVFVLHILNFATTVLCHLEAINISGYPTGIISQVQPYFDMESIVFSIGYTAIMVLLHCKLSGVFEVSKTKERADSNYWD